MQEVNSTVKENNSVTNVSTQGFTSIFLSKWLWCKQSVKDHGTDSVKAIKHIIFFLQK